MEEKQLQIDKFIGINQVIGDPIIPPGAARHVYGLYAEGDSLQRIGGKMCLHSSMKTQAQVMGITHVRFSAGREFVLIHHSTSRDLYDTDDLDTETETVVGIDEYGIGDNG